MTQARISLPPDPAIAWRHNASRRQVARRNWKPRLGVHG